MTGKLDKLAPGQLGRLISISPDEEQSQWSTEDLRCMLEHQLSCPVIFDRTHADHEAADQSSDTLTTTFKEILHDPQPAVEALMLIKQFAKRSRSSDQGLPAVIATLIYYSAIAAALLRCQQNVSNLSTRDLHEGFRWCLSQDWPPDSLVQLFKQAITTIPLDIARNIHQ